MQGQIPLDLPAWREAFPAFASFTDQRIEALYEMGSCFVWPVPQGRLGPKCAALALQLMLAHLAEGQKAADTGNASAGILTGAAVDKVSISVQGPPATTGWQHWLSTTPWGLQLWALLSTHSRGGMFVGASVERFGFRKGGGVF